MAQEIKTAFKTLVDRLKNSEEETGTGNPGLLSGVQLIEGPVQQTFTEADCPVIVYEIMDGGFAQDSQFPRSARAQMTIMLTVMTKSENGYYNDNGLGILDLYEKVMDVIDGHDEPNGVDLSAAGKWGPQSPQYKVGDVIRDGLMLTYLIEVTIQSARYERGTLQP